MYIVGGHKLNSYSFQPDNTESIELISKFVKQSIIKNKTKNQKH